MRFLTYSSLISITIITVICMFIKIGINTQNSDLFKGEINKELFTGGKIDEDLFKGEIDQRLFQKE